MHPSQLLPFPLFSYLNLLYIVYIIFKVQKENDFPKYNHKADVFQFFEGEDAYLNKRHSD